MYLINLYKTNVFRFILHLVDPIIISSPSKEGKKIDLEIFFRNIHFFYHNFIFILWFIDGFEAIKKILSHFNHILLPLQMNQKFHFECHIYHY
jgi:hypothetical protein